MTSHAAVTPALQKAIRAATFEVVRKKPEHDPLQYEKPLPFELLPFTERNDAYDSIGTAFSLGDNTYVTAAHVLVAGVNSQYGQPSLRASDGTVYSIDKVLKFSQFKDFAIFSINKDPKPAGFEINRAPQIDDAVLAVGNALGDGIVIRDGLFTSETAEDQDGRWKWIRFSAAASPGNSGGPLLDVNGKVVGIVIGKSPNENLNYSLPIKEALDAPANMAMFDQRLVTHFLILRNSNTYTYKQEFKLPLSWAEFAKSYEQVIIHHSEAARAALLSTYDSKIFPKGSGTESLLFDLDPEFAPRIINQQTDDTWQATSPSSSRADLPGDGYVTVTPDVGGGLILARLHRSDDASDDAFYNNSKAFMDAALKGLNVTRTVGEDNVRVTSLGAALSDTLVTDRYGRKWQQRVWPLPHMDAYIVGMLLPTPDGYAALLQYIPSSLLRFGKTQSNLLVDYADISYSGTLAQWQAYLKRRDLLPVVFNDLKLEYGKDFTLQAKRFVVGIPANVLPLDKASELEIGMGFIRDGEQVIWEMGSVRLDHDVQRKSYVYVSRHKQPPLTAKLDLRNEFATIQSRRSPYDMQPWRPTTETYAISSVMDAPGKTAGKISPDLVYGVTLGLEGSSGVTSLVGKERTLLSSIKVLEAGETAEVPASAHTAMRAETDDRTKAKQAARKQIEQMLRLVDEESSRYGVDIRGRTLADDVREYITQPLESVLASLENPTPESFAIWTESRKRTESLQAYWQQVPRLNSGRNVWSAFLQANHLSAITAHGLAVRNLEIKLTSLLAGPPSDEWATQAIALADAYLEERISIVKRMPLMAATGDFSFRKTQCPPASTKTSNSESAKFAPDAGPLPDNYPDASRRRFDEGVILISVKVNEMGCAVGASIVGSSGFQELDAAALELYESMRFLPAVRDGKPIVDTAKIPVKYKIEGEE